MSPSLGITVFTRRKWAVFLRQKFILCKHQARCQIRNRNNFFASLRSQVISSINVLLIIMVKYSCNNDRELMITITIIILLLLLKRITIINSEKLLDHNL